MNRMLFTEIIPGSEYFQRDVRISKLRESRNRKGIRLTSKHLISVDILIPSKPFFLIVRLVW